MKVKELLSQKNRPVETIKASSIIKEAMKSLIDKKISCLPIVNDFDELVGIISDKDIFKAVYENVDSIESSQVGSIMSTNLIVGLESDELNYIAGLMTNNKIRHIPIVDKKKIIGLVSIGDIVKNQMTDMEIENRYLQIYINGGYPG